MANWSTLKAAIAGIIKPNGNQEITGQLLQNVLNNIVSSVGENATFAGIAVPSTSPGVPDGPVFYLATETGTYSNFNDISIGINEAAILQYADGAWVKKNTGFAPIGLVDSIYSIVSAGFRFTYWSPSSSPVMESISDILYSITYNRLVIVDILGPKVFSTYGYKPVTINVNKKGIKFIYAKIIGNSSIELHYDYITNKPSENFDIGDYEKITDITKVIPLIISEGENFEDVLKIHSCSQYGGVPSFGTDVANINKAISDFNYTRGFSQYTYWAPSSAPVLEVLDDKMTVSYASLTLVNINYFIKGSTSRAFQPTELSVDIPNTDGAYLVYYDMDTKILRYETINHSSTAPNTSFYKKIVNPGYTIPLVIVEDKKILDILAISSIYIPDKFDLSVEGLARRLYPDNKTTDQVLFNKYMWDIRGNKEISTTVDIRLTKKLHNKHKFLYVRGKVDFEEGKFVNPILYIDDAGATGPTTNKFYKTLTCDAEGNFAEFVIIPDNTWDGIDFNIGYNAFVILQNNNKYNVGLHIYESFAGSYPGKDNSIVLPNEQIEDTIKYAEQLKDTINISDSDENLGNYSTKTLEGYFQREIHLDYSATTTNSEAESDGFLTEITASVKNGGPFKFKVGLLDQYPRFVVSKEFNLNLKDGLNTIDVSSLNIPIAKGEQLAISCTDISSSGSGSINWQVNSDFIEHELFYGANNGTWDKLGTEFGGEIILAYKMKSVESIFAFKSQIDGLNKQIENQNSAINSLKFIYDENNVPYKLSIRGGELVIKSVQYKKVLALGNSLTSHEYNKGIGYYGTDTWAMASTNKITTTWTNHLQTILRQKQSDAVVTPFSIATWETNYMGADLDALFSGHKGIEYDLIVVRAGENGTAGSDYAQGVDRLISYLRTNFPLADIVITDMFWHNSVKEAGFREIAEKYNYQYVSFGNIADRCLLGQMLMGKDDAFHPIIHNGVAGHCTNVCFFDFANIMASALGYSQITGKYKVSIDTSKQYSINNTNQIKDGYVTILTYGQSTPSMTIKTISNKDISSQVISLSDTKWINTPSNIPTYATVFKMPSEDVNITY